MTDKPKNRAAVSLGRKGGRAPHMKPRGLAGANLETLRKVASLGVEAKRLKRGTPPPQSP